MNAILFSLKAVVAVDVTKKEEYLLLPEVWKIKV
jgi:hypothetical protein